MRLCLAKKVASVCTEWQYQYKRTVNASTQDRVFSYFALLTSPEDANLAVLEFINTDEEG